MASGSTATMEPATSSPTDDQPPPPGLAAPPASAALAAPSALANSEPAETDNSTSMTTTMSNSAQSRLATVATTSGGKPRVRAFAACIECNKAKIKCDGDKPNNVSCTRCKQHNLTCEWAKSRRGRLPGSKNKPKPKPSTAPPSSVPEPSPTIDASSASSASVKTFKAPNVLPREQDSNKRRKISIDQLPPASSAQTHPNNSQPVLVHTLPPNAPLHPHPEHAFWSTHHAQQQQQSRPSSRPGSSSSSGPQHISNSSSPFQQQGPFRTPSQHSHPSFPSQSFASPHQHPTQGNVSTFTRQAGVTHSHPAQPSTQPQQQHHQHHHQHHQPAPQPPPETARFSSFGHDIGATFNPATYHFDLNNIHAHHPSTAPRTSSSPPSSATPANGHSSSIPLPLQNPKPLRSDWLKKRRP
ncbi:hypothetical protein OC861_000549 [Tilletia horrida]|nr:hypothetical protein OC861_000549 [Tilletia horrida]